MTGESGAVAQCRGDQPVAVYRVEAGSVVPGTWLILPTGQGLVDAPPPLKRFSTREQADQECERLNALWSAGLTW